MNQRSSVNASELLLEVARLNGESIALASSSQYKRALKEGRKAFTILTQIEKLHRIQENDHIGTISPLPCGRFYSFKVKAFSHPVCLIEIRNGIDDERELVQLYSCALMYNMALYQYYLGDLSSASRLLDLSLHISSRNEGNQLKIVQLVVLALHLLGKIYESSEDGVHFLIELCSIIKFDQEIVESDLMIAHALTELGWACQKHDYLIDAIHAFQEACSIYDIYASMKSVLNEDMVINSAPAA